MSDAEAKKPATPACKNRFGPATLETVGVLVKVPGDVLKKSPQLVLQGLKEDKFLESLTKEFQKLSQDAARAQRAGKLLRPVESLTGLAGGAGKAAGEAALRQVKESPGAKKLEQSLKNLQCAAKASAAGVFYDENKGLILILGGIVAVGGGVAAYYTRKGDLPARAVGLLPSIKVMSIGKFELKTKDLGFVPSKRTVSVGLSAHHSWSTLKTDLEVSGKFVEGKLAAAAAKGKVILNQSNGGTLDVNGNFKWSVAPQDGSAPFQAGAGVSYKLPFSNLGLFTIDASFSVNKQNTGAAYGSSWGPKFDEDPQGVSGLMGVGIAF